MRKFTLILASLFLGIGMAVAQTGIFAGCEVTFTNIQKDGTTKFTLYINDSNELALSTSSAEELGGAAKFFCEKKGDNAYSFYNREKELYLIWRGKGYGHNSDKGVLAEYSSDYCNWSITQGQVIGETQTYYFGGKRNDKSAGTLVVMKTTGVFDAWNNTQAYNDNYTNLYDINIVNREYVAHPAGFENGKIYTFVTERGWMGAKDDNNNVISTAKTSHNLTGNKEEENFQWTVYKSKNGNYYLYNIGKEMFMGVQASNNASVPFVASPAGKNLTFKVSSNLQYPLMFSTNNAAVVNHSDRYGDGCISWTGGWGTLNDTGSNHKVEVVGDASAEVLAKIEKLVEVREIGYFRLKGHSGNYIDASNIYNNATATAGQMSMKSDANCNLAGTIFYYDDDNKFKNYATGTHIRVTREIGNKTATDGNTWQVYISATEGKFKLLSNANNWLHDNSGNRADRCSAEGDHANTTHSWILEKVAEKDLPGVAKIDDTQYPTLAEAIDAAQSGKTIQLQRSTDEECLIPAGVSFEKKGSTILAPNVKVAVAAVDGTSYATLAEAVAAVQAGQTLVLWADTDEEFVLPMGVTLDKNDFDAPNVTVAEVVALAGEGTEADPYLINNVYELVFFRNSVNAGETKYNADGVYVALGADIDLAGQDWSVNIGDDCNATFDGIFDGKNHKIMNLTSTETAEKADGYICTGLFGAIAGNAVVKDLTIENVTINAEYVGNNVGAVVGFALSASGSIENVTVTGNININASSVTGVGAILGYDYYSPALKVEDCKVIGAEGSSSIVGGAAYVGGLVGYASSKIAMNGNTVENVTVTGSASVAAIAGIMLAGGSAADNTVKNVSVEATKELWYNSAAVVAGTMTSNGTITISNTTVESVTINGTEFDDSEEDAYASFIVGGIHATKPTSPIAKVEAKIGDTYYATFEAAMAAEGTDNVELLVEKSIVLKDGEAYTYTKGAADVDVEYTRTLIAGIWNPVYIPFDATVRADEFEVAEFTTAKGTTITLEKLDANEDGAIDLSANTAYVVRPIDGNELILDAWGYIYSNKEVSPQPLGNEGFSVRGNYNVLTGADLNEKTDRVVGSNGNWGKLKSASTLKPYRLILTIPAGVDASAISMRVEDEDTTSIETLETMTEVTIYDLMGRRVETMTEGGIYIVNGKKVVIK